MSAARALAPDFTVWNTHDGGDCPVREDAMVIIRYRNGKEIGPVPAKSRRWKRWSKKIGLSDFDVKQFKLVEAG